MKEYQQTERTDTPDKERLTLCQNLVISTRTFHQTGKFHQLYTGCAAAGIDIAGIQEHWLLSTSAMGEMWSDDKEWLFVYSPASPLWVGGTGLPISRRYTKCLQSVTSISDRILSASFSGNPNITITVVYAPTESAEDTAKDKFYTDLASHCEQIPRHNIHLILGDFNARIGKDSHGSSQSVVGTHCFHHVTNENGQRLIDLCEEYRLRPAQRRFPHPSSRIWTWQHPSGRNA